MTTLISVSEDRIMKALAEFTGIVMALFFMATFAHCGNGCQEAKDSLNDPAHNYATEIVACAATAGYPGRYDRDADMRCRGAVNAKYNLAGSDGGADAGR